MPDVVVEFFAWPKLKVPVCGRSSVAWGDALPVRAKKKKKKRKSFTRKPPVARSFRRVLPRVLVVGRGAGELRGSCSPAAPPA